jgi:hypothetical protein
LSRAGDQVQATIIAPVSSHGQTVIPQGSKLFGSIKSLERLGLGLKQVTAKIHYQFDTIQFLDGEMMEVLRNWKRSREEAGSPSITQPS